MSGKDGTIRCAIREYRRRRGLSQDELAHLIGVGRQAVYDMESGRYLPNTAVALRLARVLGCAVERLFVEDIPARLGGIHLLHQADAAARLSLAQVREKLVGVPLHGARTASLKLDAADGFLLADKTLDCELPRAQLARTLLVLGCDPALGVLGGLMARAAPGIRAHTVFASSREALLAVNAGNAHVAGVHYHSFGAADGNMEAVRTLAPGMDCLVIAFSVQEEGFMVASGNPLAIRAVEDLANGRSRFVNREEGAALRKLLDAQLARHGVPSSALRGYTEEVHSHSEGAVRVAGGSADAALGLRIIAELFGLDFVPLAVTRCDLVIPSDLREHPGITALLDVLQSSGIRKELGALSGYDPSSAGKVISGGLPAPDATT
ncbi:MAG: helix-turn-helix domain-containing protein [Deltaproteobacteria bacterium]|jgi:molybdate-binding protein/DNA-binding XRE family transcriptional regulator|nr:helix-turn-helix domain-containing protein [Deltaproteobacteria bacterium]